jgi:hypothetical protein
LLIFLFFDETARSRARSGITHLWNPQNVLEAHLSPFTPARWSTYPGLGTPRPKSNVAGRLHTPDGEYHMVAYRYRSGWNCLVIGPAGYKQHAVACNEAQLTYEEARDQLYGFCVDVAVEKARDFAP